MSDYYEGNSDYAFDRALEEEKIMGYGGNRRGGGRRGGKSKSDNYVYSSSFTKSVDSGRGAKKVHLEEDVTEIFAFSLTEEKAEQFLKKFQDAMDSRDGDGGVRITAYCNAKENDKTGEVFDSASILIVGKYPSNQQRKGGGRRSYKDDDDGDDKYEARGKRSRRDEEDDDDRPSRRKGRSREEEEEEEDRNSSKERTREDRQEARGKRGRDSEYDDEDERETRKGDKRGRSNSSREDSERSSRSSRSSSKKHEVEDDDEIPF